MPKVTPGAEIKPSESDSRIEVPDHYNVLNFYIILADSAWRVTPKENQSFWPEAMKYSHWWGLGCICTLEVSESAPSESQVPQYTSITIGEILFIYPGK